MDAKVMTPALLMRLLSGCSELNLAIQSQIGAIPLCLLTQEKDSSSLNGSILYVETVEIDRRSFESRLSSSLDL